MSDLSAVATLLRTLADETRLRVLHLVWRSDPVALRVGDLVAVLQRPQPAVSQHLAVLRTEGLVVARRRGREQFYALPSTQRSDHAAVLSALESLVPDTPEAVEDLERLRALERPLTDPGSGATKRLHDEQRAEPGDAAMTEVLGALRHPTRRKLMDDIGSRPGASLNEIAGPYPTSRAALGKHLAVLERAGLVLSRREGRRRRLYINRVPIQLVYDRWTTRFVAPLAQHVAATKYAVEGGGR